MGALPVGPEATNREFTLAAWVSLCGWIAAPFGLAAVVFAALRLAGARRWITLATTGIPLLLGSAFALLAMPLLIMLTTLPFEQNAGPFDKALFTAVVERVRQLGIKPGEQLKLRLDKLTDPKSLRRLKSPNETFDRGTGAGTLWAERTAEGKLKVVIETRDLGHAGEYGFAYSDVPLSPLTGLHGEACPAIEVPGPLSAPCGRRKIDDHWCEVENPRD